MAPYRWPGSVPLPLWFSAVTVSLYEIHICSSNDSPYRLKNKMFENQGLIFQKWLVSKESSSGSIGKEIIWKFFCQCNCDYFWFWRFEEVSRNLNIAQEWILKVYLPRHLHILVSTIPKACYNNTHKKPLGRGSEFKLIWEIPVTRHIFGNL
jgi:hypothetical protein